MSADPQRVVVAAARNNAEWCDLVCRSHGLPTRWSAVCWSSPQRTPPLYPDAVTLVPATTGADLHERIDGAPGCSIKDSYACLDLAPAGFRVLFEAEWLVWRPQSRPATLEVTWRALREAGQLAEWVHAWDAMMPVLLPGLLESDDVLVLGGFSEGALVAGLIANRSDDVVGVSNAFGAWSGGLQEVLNWTPDLPVVGYEQATAPDTARRVGFEPIGPLRVWLLG